MSLALVRLELMVKQFIVRGKVDMVYSKKEKKKVSGNVPTLEDVIWLCSCRISGRSCQARQSKLAIQSSPQKR